MKRNKIMFVIAIVAILAVLFVACDEGAQPEHTHTYGAWSIATQPTETTTGTATRACVSGDNTETVEIANLSDATVWTVEASQDATHTAKGFKVYKSVYGTVTVTTEKTTEHTYGAWTLTKNPTATETGTAKRTCACGDVDEATVAVLTDASVWTTATSQDPTHESKGFVQYTSEYGTVLVEVAAGQHTFNNWTLKTAPTLTETGLALKTCVCGHYEEETVAVLTDTTVWTKQHTDATHAAAGSDVYTSVYGSVTIVIPQVEHNFTGELRNNGDGTHSHKCTGCDVYSEAVAHDFNKKIVDDAHKATDADCTNAATYYYSCECGAVSTELTFESGKALGHNYSDYKITKEPTLTETGLAFKTCACGYYKEETVAVLTDTEVWTKQHTDATHAAAGSDVYTSVYGSVTIVIPQVEHIFTGELRDNGDGTHSHKCTGCDAYSEAVAHDFNKKIVDNAHIATKATCTNAATYYYSCECGAVSTELTFESGKALGHNYSEFKVTKEPTCTETGTADSICSVCGDTQHNTIAALGHKFTQYEPVMDTDYWGDTEIELDTSQKHVKKCEVCGVKATSEEVHKYGKEYLHVDNADYAYAYKDCTLCGYTDKEHATSLGELSTWTVKETKEADYNQEGYTIYTKGEYEYKKEFAKLVAPYDGKTYTVFELKINDEGAFNNYHWSAAKVTFNENGEGTGTAYPFSGTTKFTMVDPTTGAIRHTLGSNSFEGYVDFETGIIITTARGLYDDVFMFVPVDSGIKSEDINGSILAGSIATSYTTLCNLHESHTFNILINDESVLFGVKFEGKDGNVLNSADCESADYVKVYAKDGKVLAAYQKNASGTFQETDGKEGAYNDANFGEVVLDGIGGATIGGKVGVYSYNADKAYYELYVGTSQADATAYYTFTLAEDGITVDKPMTTITYDTAYGADTIGDEYKQANNNVKFTLPVLTGIEEAGVNEFVGWTIDGQEGYVTEYTPDGTAVTFTAVWKAVYTVTIIDGAEGVESVNVPDGEVIYDRLPVWGKVDNRRFVGWFVDSNNDGKYTEEDDELDETLVATSNITLIAVWREIPAYVGTYYGTELYNKGWGNSRSLTLSIDEDGNISGVKTGKVNSYDAATQTITWTGGKFYFDAEAEIILGIYDDNNIGYDYYFFGKDLATDGKVVANYGVYATQVGGTLIKYYAQFIQAKTALGDNTNVFTYGNRIYSGVEIKDVAGNTLVIDKSASNSIDKSASVLVYKDGKVVFARLAPEGKATIGDGTDKYVPRELDAYFGTYTCEGKDSLVLDGAGGFTWGDKVGTYVVTSAESKLFDLYVVEDGKNVEYYAATLNDKTYTAEKPMVTVTYTTAVTPVETFEVSVQVNKNIEITLPALTNADNVFRGWLIAGSETLYNGAYTPKDNVDFTAKWDTKYTFKAVYNDGKTENLVKTYGEGDIVNVEKPVWAKHRFDGWFTTESFDEGTEWTSGSAITADITVYAKWSDAEAYYNNYTDMELSGTNANGATSSLYSRSMTLSIDADGNYSGTMYPFNGTGKISNYDKATGKMNLGSFYAVLDSATGIIVASRNDDFSDVFFMTPFETKTSTSAFSSSYWNGGKTRVIEYTCDGTTYRVFINGGNVYFNVTFMSALTGGTAVAGADCYKTSTLYVLDSEGNKVESFAYNGTTMVATDGTEGTYMNVDAKYVLNGAGLIDIYNQDGVLVNSGTYTKSEDSSYQYDVILGATSHKLSVDKDTYTVTGFESNYVTITYMDGENIVKTDEGVYKLIESDLWADYNVEGFIFRGWYLDGDESQTLVKKYTATGNATFVAKLDRAVSLTIVYGNGLEDKTVAYGTGDALNMSNHQPEYTNGKVFDHWYTLDGETQVTFTDKTISANITVYCAWVEAVKWYGTYVGKDVYGNSESTSYQANLTVSATGVASGSVKGTINAAGTAIVEGSSSRFMAYDGDAVITAYNYTSNINGEFYFFAKGDAGTQVRQYKHLGAVNKVVVSYIKNGETIYALVWGNKVYDNVTWTSTDGDIAAKDLYNHVSSLTFYSRAGEAIVLD